MDSSNYFEYVPENLTQQAQDVDMNYDSSPKTSQENVHTEEDERVKSDGSYKNGVDFRRKKNWSERILVEITGWLHVLSPYGNILYCSESTMKLTGYRPYELVGQKLVEFLHVDDIDIFIRDFQMSFHTRSQITTYYRFRKKDDTYILFEALGKPGTRVAGQRPDAFYSISQPVLSKNGTSIDTFLELKSENEWLKNRIKELSDKYGKMTIDSDEGEIQQLLEASPKKEKVVEYNEQAWLDCHMVEVESIDNTKDIAYNEEFLEKKDKWKRKKKDKEADVFVCKDCGITKSPEWRKGPQGPKTLCNACGLRWAKRNRKKNTNSS